MTTQGVEHAHLTLWARFRWRFTRPGTASVWPVQLVFRDTHRPAIVHGLGPAVLVAALIAEDLASEHDRMVIARRKSAYQPPSASSDRARDSASGPAIASSASNSRKVQTDGWAADTDADTSRRLTPASLRPATLSSAPIFRLSARRVPFTMHQALQPGLAAARYCAIVPGGFTPYLQQQFTFCRRLRDWPLPKAGRAA